MAAEGITLLEVAMIRTAILSQWLSRLIERLRLDVEGRMPTRTPESDWGYITKRIASGANGSSPPDWKYLCAMNAATNARDACDGFIQPRERRDASDVDAETSSGCMSAQKA